MHIKHIFEYIFIDILILFTVQLSQQFCVLSFKIPVTNNNLNILKLLFRFLFAIIKKPK